MEVSRLLMRDTTIHKYFPKCITRPECDCFDDLQNNTNSDDVNLYINQSINLLEKYLYLIKIHHNKESIVEVVYMVKIPTIILKSSIHFIANTKKIFEKMLPKDKKCNIDFPNKPITVNQYLHYIGLFCSFNKFVIEMMYYDYSKISIEYLKNILEVHLELLFIFEQFLKIQKYGYSFASETVFGSKNFIQLYWI